MSGSMRIRIIVIEVVNCIELWEFNHKILKANFSKGFLKVRIKLFKYLLNNIEKANA